MKLVYIHHMYQLHLLFCKLLFMCILDLLWFFALMIKIHEDKTHTPPSPPPCPHPHTLKWIPWRQVFCFCFLFLFFSLSKTHSVRKKYTSGPRYWNVPVLVNTGTFLVYQYCLKMWYLHSLERSGVSQKLTILERKNDLVLSNTRVPVSGTWSILFPSVQFTLSVYLNKPLSGLSDFYKVSTLFNHYIYFFLCINRHF